MQQSIPAVALPILSLAAGLVACRPAGQAAVQGGAAQQQQSAQLEALTRKRQARESTFQQMNTQQLAQELAADSKRGVEPFNSLPYRLLLTRGSAAAGALKESLTGADHTSFLGLLALRAVDSAQYRDLPAAFRIGVLVDALKTARTFNAWGLPHLTWEDAAKALIAEGRPAEPALRPLLKDCRPAPMWGSEEVMESARYKYRLCDYAWALMLASRGETVSIPMEPEARDRLIEPLLQR
jgi:hypothetical protein